MSHYIILDTPQRSDAWFQARCGRLTGTRAKAMLATIKSGEAAARRDARTAMVCERLTGRPQEDGWINNDMLRGIEMEPAAIAAYELATGKMVRSTGFLAHTELMAGCSLDGDVDDMQGIIEVKAPRSATHLRYLLTRGLPADYHAQVLHNLWISGAAYCDFVSFDDRLPEPLHLFIHRVVANEFDLMAYERTVRAFLSEVDAEYAAVLGLLPGGGVTPSPQAYRYYWSQIVKPIADATDGGFTPEELHTAMKQRFLDGRSTTELTRAEFSEYCDDIVRWAEALGVRLEEPEP